MPDRFSRLPDSLKIEIYTFDMTYRIIMRRVLCELLCDYNEKKYQRYPSFILI